MTAGLAPPGSKATTVAANVWDLAFETVSRARSDLSSTFHRICSSRKDSVSLPDWKVWPMPLPFPEMHAQKARRRQVDGPRKMALNYLVLILNFIAAGESPVVTDNIGLGSRLSRGQWAVVKRLQPLVDSWNSQPDVDASAMGRSAAKVESIEALLKERCRRMSVLLGLRSTVAQFVQQVEFWNVATTVILELWQVRVLQRWITLPRRWSRLVSFSMGGLPSILCTFWTRRISRSSLDLWISPSSFLLMMRGCHGSICAAV